MPYPVSMDLQQKTAQSFKQLQRLIMSRQMQQAIHLLQLPVMELAPVVEMELEQNPVLDLVGEGEEEKSEDIEAESLEEDTHEDPQEIDSDPQEPLKFDDQDFEVLRRLDEDFRDYVTEGGNYSAKRTSEEEKLQSFLETSLRAESTLFEHLMGQANEAFEDKHQVGLAEALIGNFDHSGFLSTSLEEIAVLQKCSVKDLEKILETIQTFHPFGVGARSLQESMLIQLCCQGKQDTLAYSIIEKHFDDFLHNRIPAIKKSMRCTAEQIEEAIDQSIIKLDLHPGTGVSKQTIQYITADVAIKQEGDDLEIVINDESMPRLRLNSRYLRMLEDDALPQETKDFIRQKVSSAKWLLRNIMQRNETLEKIAASLAKWQRAFFLSRRKASSIDNENNC